MGMGGFIICLAIDTKGVRHHSSTPAERLNTCSQRKGLSLIYLGPTCGGPILGLTTSNRFQLRGARLLQIYDGSFNSPLSPPRGSGSSKPAGYCFEVLCKEGALDSKHKCGLDQTAELVEQLQG